MQRTIFLTLFVLLFALSGFAATLHVQIARVVDGDTVEINVGGEERDVRLNCIDAPEMAQDYGVNSQQNLQELVSGKFVKIETYGQDQYGRLIGTIYHQGTDINLMQVKQGSAWVYDRYCKNKAYYKAENKAKNNKKGLWQLDNAVEPWKYRH